jgi:hypothetical protein
MNQFNRFTFSLTPNPSSGSLGNALGSSIRGPEKDPAQKPARVSLQNPVANAARNEE